MALLDDPERKSWQNPQLLLRVGRVAPGHMVVDVGAGTGYLAFPAADVVKPMGRVFAVDVQAEMVHELRRRARESGNQWVVPVLASESYIPIGDDFMDVAFLVNALHELDGNSTLRQIRRILRPLGRFVVVDWKKEAMDRGPPVEHRVDPRTARTLVESASFDYDQSFSPGPYHWGLLFVRSADKGF